MYYEVLGSTGGRHWEDLQILRGTSVLHPTPAAACMDLGLGAEGDFSHPCCLAPTPGHRVLRRGTRPPPQKKKNKELVPKGRGWFRSGAIVHPQPWCRKVAAAALGPESSKLGFLPLHRGGSDGAGGKHPRCAPPVNWGR